MKESQNAVEKPSVTPSEETRNIYLAFCDILGFSNMVMNNFDETLTIYREFSDSIMGADFLKHVEITVYSDSILITGEDLYRVATAVQILWFTALSRNFMIRGAIAYGKYWERKSSRSLMVVSDALVRTVHLESSIGVPAVVIADDIEIGDFAWAAHFVQDIFSAPILHFRDRNIINPFNRFWFQSAGHRARMLLEENPKHKDKYLWFLALHAAVDSGKNLTPEGKLEQLIADSVIQPVMTPPEE